MELFVFGEHVHALAAITGKRHHWKKALLAGYELDDGNAVRSAQGTVPGVLVTDVAIEDLAKLDLAFKKPRLIERVHVGKRIAHAFVYVDGHPDARKKVAARQQDAFLRLVS